MEAQDGGEFPADGLRQLGEAMQSLVADMIARADEVDAVVIDSTAVTGDA